MFGIGYYYFKKVAMQENEEDFIDDHYEYDKGE
jgi:hypothetical protein